MDRARRLDASFQAFNKCPDGHVMQQIRDNAWIGTEFLEWMLVNTLDPEALHFTDGPQSAWLDNRLVMSGPGSEGQQKVTVSGAQDRFSEVIHALQQGKEMCEATIFMDRLEHQWRMTLKGELFRFASVKCPTVRIDKDANIEDERLAIFYERVAVIEDGLALFDALLRDFFEMKKSEDKTQAYMERKANVLA